MTSERYKVCVGLSFAAVILSVPLAFVLPVEWSFENGLIENAQVVVLLISAVFISNVRSEMKWFQRLFAAGLVLIALRELSWGRVFFPIAMEDLGPVFVEMADYEYRIPVYIFIGVYVAMMIFILIRFVPVMNILRGSQPLAAFGVIFFAALFNHIGDQGYIIGKAGGQILEELNELILYAVLFVVGLYYCKFSR